MRRLLIDEGVSFFKRYMGVDINGKKHMDRLVSKIDDVNIMKSKVVGLLPVVDLFVLVNHPCDIRIWNEMKGRFVLYRDMNYMNDKISSFKRLRAYHEVSESSVCSMCNMRNICSMKNKTPDNKYTSSRDVFIMMYYIVKSAQYRERMTAGDTDSQSDDQPHLKKDNKDSVLQGLLEEEADRQMSQYKLDSNELDILPDDIKPDHEFAYYLSAIRVLDSLSMLVPKTSKDKESLQELLENHVNEFTIKKRTDIILETKTTINRSISKKKKKRDETKGIHELILESNHRMKEFERPLEVKKENTMGRED